VGVDPAAFTMEAVLHCGGENGDVYEGVLKTSQRISEALRRLES
jgi:hypothetical protein